MEKSKPLTYVERQKIEQLLKEGTTQTEIGQMLGVGYYTISREIKRTDGEVYTAAKAQANANRKKRRQKQTISNKSLMAWEKQKQIIKEKMRKKLLENPDMTAYKIAKETGLSQNTVRKYYKEIKAEAECKLKA